MEKHQLEENHLCFEGVCFSFSWLKRYQLERKHVCFKIACLLGQRRSYFCYFHFTEWCTGKTVFPVFVFLNDLSYVIVLSVLTGSLVVIDVLTTTVIVFACCLTDTGCKYEHLLNICH